MCLPFLQGNKSTPALPAAVPSPVPVTAANTKAETDAASAATKRAGLIALGNKSNIQTSPLGLQEPAKIGKAGVLGQTASSYAA